MSADTSPDDPDFTVIKLQLERGPTVRLLERPRDCIDVCEPDQLLKPERSRPGLVRRQFLKLFSRLDEHMERFTKLLPLFGRKFLILTSEDWQLLKLHSLTLENLRIPHRSYTQCLVLERSPRRRHVRHVAMILTKPRLGQRQQEASGEELSHRLAQKFRPEHPAHRGDSAFESLREERSDRDRGR